MVFPRSVLSVGAVLFWKRQDREGPGAGLGGVGRDGAAREKEGRDSENKKMFHRRGRHGGRLSAGDDENLPHLDEVGVGEVVGCLDGIDGHAVALGYQGKGLPFPDDVLSAASRARS